MKNHGVELVYSQRAYEAIKRMEDEEKKSPPPVTRFKGLRPDQDRFKKKGGEEWEPLDPQDRLRGWLRELHVYTTNPKGRGQTAKFRDNVTHVSKMVGMRQMIEDFAQCCSEVAVRDDVGRVSGHREVYFWVTCTTTEGVRETRFKQTWWFKYPHPTRTTLPADMRMWFEACISFCVAQGSSPDDVAEAEDRAQLEVD